MRWSAPWTVLVLLAVTGLAQAQTDDRLRQPRLKPKWQTPKPSRASANPCAEYGAGFARIEGSSTCVRIGGSVGVSVGGGSSIGR